MTHTTPPPAKPPGASATRRRDPKATRDRLVRSALELFTTRGYHGTTTPLIAERAAVAEGTIYRHFDSKEHLLNEIYRAGVRLFAAAVRDAPPAEACRERLERVAITWREIAVRNPAVVRLVFVNRLGDLLDQKSRDTARDFRSEVEKLIASGKSAGQVRPGSVNLWADVWLELVGLMLERVASREWAPEIPAVQTMIDSAWGAIGLTAQQPAAPPPPPAAAPPGPPLPPSA